MLKEEFQTMCNAGANKVAFFKKNPLGYFVAAMLAGMFISFGSFVTFTLGSFFVGTDLAPFAKPLQGLAFGVALSLVVMAGGELFTGNNMVVGAAAMRKKVSWGDTVKLWIFCWLGNLAASLLCVGCFVLSGVPDGNVGAYFASVAQTKVGFAPIPLFFRAILCNIMVCLGVWCGLKMKSESGKLIMIILSIFTFMVCGFEHSIANMSIEGVALFQGNISLGSYLYSLGVATLGNIVGGVVCTALPYHIISKEK